MTEEDLARARAILEAQQKQLTEAVKKVEALLGDHLHEQGKAGYTVSIAGNRVILTYRSAEGVSQNAPKSAFERVSDTLKKAFPKLDNDVFYGYVETVRRKQSWGSRWQALMKSGRARMFESLDPNPDRQGPLPASRSALNTTPTRNLPRIYTFVDLGPPAVRHIYLSEFKLGRQRPDEGIIRYLLSPEELALVTSDKPKPFFDILKQGVTATDLSVHLGDPNRELSAQELNEHFKKSLEGLRRAIFYLARPPPEGLGLKLQGLISASTTDTILGPSEIALTSDLEVLSIVRRVEQEALKQGRTSTSVRSFVQFFMTNGALATVIDEAKVLVTTGLPEGLSKVDLRPIVEDSVRKLGRLLVVLRK